MDICLASFHRSSLYLIIKDHPFSDGNKRIGSFLFMLYLQQEGMAHQLNPPALTALALLIAESTPASKDLMIRLIINLLAERGAGATSPSPSSPRKRGSSLVENHWIPAFAGMTSAVQYVSAW
jgi:hypothetical protein